jgi:hypothetical protein
MKLIEKLAKEYCVEVDRYCDIDVARGFESGFRKAREMAAAQVRAEPYMQPQANCLEFRIEQLGDSEVEDDHPIHPPPPGSRGPR